MKYVVIVFIAFILMAGQCKKISFVTHYCGVEIRNNSPRTIGACLGYGYPDISIPEDSTIGGVLTGSYRILDTEGYCEDVFESLPKDTLSLFIFNIDTFSYYSWREIRNGYKILKRYDLSYQDLENSNWTITYP